MADMMSILSSNYLAVGQNMASNSTGTYVPVDADAWQGTWTGKYGNNQSFTLQISNVQGFRAKVKYQSGSTVNYGDVLIKNNSFRIGDSRFDLASTGTGVMSTVITDPVTGGTNVLRAYANLT